jgi:CRP/FNR family transcriptional regulator
VEALSPYSPDIVGLTRWPAAQRHVKERCPMQTIERLADVLLFSGLKPGELELIAQYTRRRRLPANVTVVYQDAPGTALYVILSGKVKVHTATPEGRDVLLAFLNAGEPFGELSLLDGKGCSADVTTLEPTGALVLTRSDFQECIRQSPQIAINLLAALAGRVRFTNAMMVAVLALDAPGRLSRLLLILADEYGAKTPEGIQIDARIPQSDLADWIGVTRETVARILSQYRTLGWLAIDEQRRITLLRPDQLARRSEGCCPRGTRC